MALASKLLRRLDKARGIAGRLGLHPFSVILRTNRWDGGRPGVGTLVTADAQLFVNGNQNPKVKQVSSQDAILSNGVYSNQDIKIGPLTPPFAAGGVSYASLDPALNPGTEFFFKITGPGEPSAGQWFVRLSDEADSALHIYIVVRATGTTPPGGP